MVVHRDRYGCKRPGGPSLAVLADSIYDAAHLFIVEARFGGQEQTPLIELHPTFKLGDTRELFKGMHA